MNGLKGLVSELVIQTKTVKKDTKFYPLELLYQKPLFKILFLTNSPVHSLLSSLRSLHLHK